MNCQPSAAQLVQWTWDRRIDVQKIDMKSFNLDSAVVRTSLAQPLDLPGKPKKSLITNKVTSIFSDSPDKPICCTINARPTAESRFNWFRDQLMFVVNDVNGTSVPNPHCQ
ncbi:MAG: hypothetical protein HQL68_01670 [Magnetococcales bacterium]|nr:hypothetical protein [Magnetococcales bacterium]